MEKINLDKLFNPESLAMVGASADFGEWGFTILFNGMASMPSLLPAPTSH